MSTYVVISMLCVLLFFGFVIVRKIGFSKIIEKVTIFSFKLACSFAFLFIVHVIVDEYNVVVPVNIFSATTIAALGIPGILCIGVLTLLK